jgi:hypothetical protein
MMKTKKLWLHMHSIRSRRATMISVLGGSAVLGAVLALAPMASADVYRTSNGEIAVATAGEHAHAQYLAVSNGGNATATGVGGTAVSTTGTADGYSTAVSGTGCAVSHYGRAAVSVAGCVESGAIVGVAPLGPIWRSGHSNGESWIAIGGLWCAEGLYVTVTVTGCADGAIAVSASGNTSANPVSWFPGLAVSLFGSATNSYGPGAAVSGTSYARGSTVAVAGWSAEGDLLAVSGTGPATARGGRVGGYGTYQNVQGVAVSGTGDATANGGLLAVSGTGKASGARVNVDSTP